MSSGFIPTHGQYKRLLSYRKASIIYDATVCFCRRFFGKFDRTIDQMVQAARSGKQNIVEGSQASGTSKEGEIKLTNVARASFEELLEDYYDYLRTHQLQVWEKSSKAALAVRELAYHPEESYMTYQAYIEGRSAETTANIIICLIHQCTFLLGRQIKFLEQDFIKHGGLRERMYHARQRERQTPR
jgi:four helix bundle suffix protein